MVKATVACATLAATLVLTAATPARADSIIKNPGDHPDYSVELEPHALLGWGNLYASTGFGIGGRASVPIVKNGFIKTINNSVAISFGLDWLRYDHCYYYDRRGGRNLGYGCGASFLLFPVAMQWNFWLTEKWSVFGEPGLYVYHGIFDDYCSGLVGCSSPTRTSVDFAFYAGGRFHFNDKVSLTMRIGYPTLSVGVSFFP
ncbi:hypothetical protein [Labilithrix luteola]|nr:hypothetical protein [Labilithrix luteola]